MIMVGMEFIDLFAGAVEFFSQMLDHTDSRCQILFDQSVSVLQLNGGAQSKNLVVFLGAWMLIAAYPLNSSLFVQLARDTDSTVLGLEHSFFGQNVDDSSQASS
jgi:hypothetical protein